MKIKIVNLSSNPLPKFQTTGSAGMDIQACVEGVDVVVIPARGKGIISTGIFMQIPEGYECQVRPRSGLAFNKSITVLNSPGTIDSDYRGEIKVVLINHGIQPFHVFHGDRIAQLVFNKIEQPEFELVEELDSTDRGEGGFGSTGVK